VTVKDDGGTQNGGVDATEVQFTVTVNQVGAQVSAISAFWGTKGTAALRTAADGLRLLPAGRSIDLPWDKIDALQITLSQPASLSPSDVSVTGIAVANYGPVTISGSGTNYTIAFARPVNVADRVTITIGNAGIATFTRWLDVLPGDVNDDGVVNTTDGVLILNNMTPAHPYNVFYDINGDGVVNTTDFTQYRPFIGTTLPSLPPLLAVRGEGTGGFAPLTPAQLTPVLAAAIDSWPAAGLPAPDVARLCTVTIQITALPAGYLGGTALGGMTVDLSADAAGWRWFIDATPGPDAAFARPQW